MAEARAQFITRALLALENVPDIVNTREDVSVLNGPCTKV